MKIYFNIPDWGNRWIPYIYDALKEFDRTQDIHEADVLFSAWCNEWIQEVSNQFPEKTIISYCRRYEMFQDITMEKINWDAVNALIFVSDYGHELFQRLPYIPEKAKQVKNYVIYNGVDVRDFPFREDPPRNKQIAFVASTRWVKNHAMLCQILMQLPEEYRVHVIGLPGTADYTITISEYMANLGFENRIIPNGLIPSEDVPQWLMNKELIISCSLNEGNPVNLIEAMAMGIKPVIHNWPGSRDQFPNNLVFDSVSRAAEIIQEDEYFPRSYRNWIEDKYSVNNFNQLSEIVKEHYNGSKV